MPGIFSINLYILKSLFKKGNKGESHDPIKTNFWDPLVEKRCFKIICKDQESKFWFFELDLYKQPRT